MVDYSSRSTEIEIMDDLKIEGEVVPKTLRELEIINKLLGGNSVTIKGIKSLLSNNNQNGEGVSIADMGCGGGDMLKLIANWAKKNGIKVKLTGIDANPNIIDYARKNTRGYDNIEYKTDNVFNNENEQQNYCFQLSSSPKMEIIQEYPPRELRSPKNL